MVRSFIDNLHAIVINHLTNENFCVGNLASLLGISTSKTLKKAKADTGKSVNNEVRIIIQLIDAKNDKHICLTVVLEDKYGLK